MDWAKTARGLWEARDGVYCAQVEHDNGTYVWRTYDKGTKESFGRGVVRRRKEATELAEKAISAEICRREAGVSA